MRDAEGVQLEVPRRQVGAHGGLAIEQDGDPPAGGHAAHGDGDGAVGGDLHGGDAAVDWKGNPFN